MHSNGRFRHFHTYVDRFWALISTARWRLHVVPSMAERDVLSSPGRGMQTTTSPFRWGFGGRVGPGELLPMNTTAKRRPATVGHSACQRLMLTKRHVSPYSTI